MTLPMLTGFAEYWRETPPVNELVAAYLGATGSKGSRAEIDRGPQEDAPDLLALFPRKG